MPATAEALSASGLQVNSTLLDAIVQSTEKALQMCDMRASCVGASRVPSKDGGLVTGMIGVHGAVSGFMTVNMSEKFAIKAVNQLMQDDFGKELTAEVIDGAGELTNMIVGGAKSILGGSPWAFSHITVPSVIVGSGYSIAYARGLEFLCATFEHEDSNSVLLEDRLFTVAVSMLRR